MERRDKSAPKSLVYTFTALLADTRYRDVFDMLGIGSFQLTKRKLLQREFRALYVGLWRLALVRSFPDSHDAIFELFMEQEAAQKGNRREKAANAQLVRQYVDKLSEHGDADFSDVSRHILSLLNYDEAQTKALGLRVALHLRRMYQYFFDNLL